jgi:hypothetical protein
MSVVIIGGNDRMVAQYKDICREYGCDAKVFTQPKVNLECMIGTPDLIVLFTNPISHEMAQIARKKASQRGISLAQSHSGSCKALRGILSSQKKI